MGGFVIIANGWKLLTIITKRSILDVAAALDPPTCFFLFLEMDSLETTEGKLHYTLHIKMKFCIKDLFSKCDQIRRILRILLRLLKKSLMENFIFCAVMYVYRFQGFSENVDLNISGVF